MGGLKIKEVAVLNEDNPEFFEKLLKDGADAVKPEMEKQLKQSDKFILDACCGGRCFWFNKSHPNTLYIDNRVAKKGHIGKGYNPNHEVKPDIVMDFRKLEFLDNRFKLVVFDPPHLLSQVESSMMKKKFGDLKKETWEHYIKKGFEECWRVLDNYGTLIFKWNEVHIPFKKVLSIIPQSPLFGHRTAKHGRTIWWVFMKIPRDAIVEKNETGEEK